MDGMLEKKALLSLGGGVRLPEGYEVPCRISHSTAGPGAGFGSVAISFGRFRVKKSISYDSGEFELHVSDDGKLSLTHGGEPFLDEVELQPVVRHCPEQAFFNLDPRCIYHCAYCSSPLLDMSEDKHLSTEKIMDMLAESVSEHDVKAVSFTSGVVGSIDDTVDRLVDVVSRVRSAYPDMPIGVEPYVSSPEHIRRIKEAGADEIKLNLETPRRDIFAKVCPDLDYDGIMGLLEEAVKVFGRGRVISNIIYGLGETDGDLRDAAEMLCSIGVIPGFRALRVNKFNRDNLKAAIGEPVPVTPERAMAVARMQKEVMQEYGMTSLTSVTMCLECGCCDLVPFRDLRRRYQPAFGGGLNAATEDTGYDTPGTLGEDRGRPGPPTGALADLEELVFEDPAVHRDRQEPLGAEPPVGGARELHLRALQRRRVEDLPARPDREAFHGEAELRPPGM